MVQILRGACVAIACGGIGTAIAAGTDDLWEVTTQMNMPGLPAGMGAQKSQVCAEKGDMKKASQGRGSEKCTMKNFKQSGNSVHMEMSCPEGDAVMDTTYNAAHSEYKGTMKMTSKRGDMTMTMAGRKIGTCDAKQVKAEREEKVAVMKQQAAQSQAQLAAMWDQQIATCKRAPETMKIGDLGLCAQSATCQRGNDPQANRAIDACSAGKTEYCRRYQTLDGFVKAGGDEQGAALCNVSRSELVARHCSQAQESENLAYLNKYCPAQAKTVAQAHCVGFDYTSKVKTKYSDFCRAYLAHASVDEQEQPSMAAKIKADPKAAVQEGVSQGINKLKGLFGR